MPASERQEQHEDRREHLEEARAFMVSRISTPDEGAHHEDLGVGEVDELEHAVDHRVPEGDEGVHEAEDETVEEDLREDPDEELEVQQLEIHRSVAGGSKRLLGPFEAALPGPRYGYFLPSGGGDGELLDDLVVAPLRGVVARDLQDEVLGLLAVTLVVEGDRRR